MVLQDQGQIVGGGGGGGGGLHYEGVLEEAKTKKMPRPKSAPACRKHQDFQQKLKVNYNDIWLRSLLQLSCWGCGGEEEGPGEGAAGAAGCEGEEGGGGESQEGDGSEASQWWRVTQSSVRFSDTTLIIT